MTVVRSQDRSVGPDSGTLHICRVCHACRRVGRERNVVEKLDLCSLGARCRIVGLRSGNAPSWGHAHRSGSLLGRSSWNRAMRDCLRLATVEPTRGDGFGIGVFVCL